MKRQALAAALLALLAVTPLAADPGRTKAVFTCGTDKGRPPRTEGRVDTWNLSALSFTPDVRVTNPLRIPYKLITRLEFGSTPGRRADAILRPPCVLNPRARYLTILYTVSADEKQESRDRESKDSRGGEQSKDSKDRHDREARREGGTQKETTDQAAKRDEFAKEEEHVAVFELGEGVLRPTLRILETRSGKRITYQDVGASKAAR